MCPGHNTKTGSIHLSVQGPPPASSGVVSSGTRVRGCVDTRKCLVPSSVEVRSGQWSTRPSFETRASVPTVVFLLGVLPPGSSTVEGPTSTTTPGRSPEPRRSTPCLGPELRPRTRGVRRREPRMSPLSRLEVLRGPKRHTVESTVNGVL